MNDFFQVPMALSSTAALYAHSVFYGKLLLLVLMVLGMTGIAIMHYRYQWSILILTILLVLGLLAIAIVEQVAISVLDLVLCISIYLTAITTSQYIPGHINQGLASMRWWLREQTLFGAITALSHGINSWYHSFSSLCNIAATNLLGSPQLIRQFATGYPAQKKAFVATSKIYVVLVIILLVVDFSVNIDSVGEFGFELTTSLRSLQLAVVNATKITSFACGLLCSFSALIQLVPSHNDDCTLLAPVALWEYLYDTSVCRKDELLSAPCANDRQYTPPSKDQALAQSLAAAGLSHKLRAAAEGIGRDDTNLDQRAAPSITSNAWPRGSLQATLEHGDRVARERAQHRSSQHRSCRPFPCDKSPKTVDELDQAPTLNITQTPSTSQYSQQRRYPQHPHTLQVAAAHPPPQPSVLDPQPGTSTLPHPPAQSPPFQTPPASIANPTSIISFWDEIKPSLTKASMVPGSKIRRCNRQATQQRWARKMGAWDKPRIPASVSKLVRTRKLEDMDEDELVTFERRMKPRVDIPTSALRRWLARRHALADAINKRCGRYQPFFYKKHISDVFLKSTNEAIYETMWGCLSSSSMHPTPRHQIAAPSQPPVSAAAPMIAPLSAPIPAPPSSLPGANPSHSTIRRVETSAPPPTQSLPPPDLTTSTDPFATVPSQLPGLSITLPSTAAAPQATSNVEQPVVPAPTLSLSALIPTLVPQATIGAAAATNVATLPAPDHGAPTADAGASDSEDDEFDNAMREYHQQERINIAQVPRNKFDGALPNNAQEASVDTRLFTLTTLSTNLKTWYDAWQAVQGIPESAPATHAYKSIMAITSDLADVLEDKELCQYVLVLAGRTASLLDHIQSACLAAGRLINNGPDFGRLLARLTSIRDAMIQQQAYNAAREQDLKDHREANYRASGTNRKEEELAALARQVATFFDQGSTKQAWESHNYIAGTSRVPVNISDLLTFANLLVDLAGQSERFFEELEVFKTIDWDKLAPSMMDLSAALQLMQSASDRLGDYHMGPEQVRFLREKMVVPVAKIQWEIARAFGSS